MLTISLHFSKMCPVVDSLKDFYNEKKPNNKGVEVYVFTYISKDFAAMGNCIV